MRITILFCSIWECLLSVSLFSSDGRENIVHHVIIIMKSGVCMISYYFSLEHERMQYIVCLFYPYWLIEQFHYVTFWQSKVKTKIFIEYHTPVYDQKHTIKKTQQYNGKTFTLLSLKNVVITKNGNVTRFSEILYIISIISLDQWQLAKNNRQPEKLFKKVSFICRVPVYGIAPLSFKISAGTVFTKKQSLSLTEKAIERL